jgi:hypothetical protein
MTPTISMLAGALIALGSGAALAKSDKVQRTDSPPRASSVAMDARSSNASTRGANKKGFCPPGQAKKAGKGSAFNC